MLILFVYPNYKSINISVIHVYDNIPQVVQLENLVLADSPDCQEPITILIGADYYYDVVTGKIKHLNQLKKFWDLEVSSLIDSKKESDVSENQIMKNFESNIKYDEKAKRYKEGLPWKEVIRKDDLSSPDENPHFESFEKDNLPYKVLGIAWNSREDFLYFDIKGLIDFISKRIDTKRFICLASFRQNLRSHWILGAFYSQDKALDAENMASGRRDWDESLPDAIISLWADCTKAYGTVAYLRVTSYNKEILTSFVASKNRTAPLRTLTLPRLLGALLSARLSSNILKALKLDIPRFFWTDSKITYFWVRGQPERFKPFMKNRIQEIQKLTFPSNWHHYPGIQNPADIVSREVNISRLLNDTLLGYKVQNG
ncbi:integrase catalytic domain-containing protein [Trichonephila clavipes]|nr:integrase catalytic domain-containing protein [Trichonephila clavipes]